MKKTSLLHPICRMVTVVVMTLLAACSSDNDPVVTDDSADTTLTETATTGRMCITMNPTATRSLTYDGVTTTMTDGTLIGCVITSGATSSAATYYATAAWEYDKDSATLTISRWWTYDTTTGTWTLHEATSSSTTDALSYDSSGYTLINTEDYLYFYFYYPYIDPVNFEGSDDESSIASYVPRVSSSTTNNDTSGTTTYTYLMGMPVGESIASSSISSYETTTTTTTVNLTTALPVFSWKEFPVFVNQDQSTQDAINMSDFLYDACEVGVNDESVGEVTISLRKKTTAIRVTSDVELSDVKLINGLDETPITLGRYVNIYDDTETAMTSSDTYYSSSYLGTDASVSPYELSIGTMFRFILPEQTSWDGKLSYSYSTTDDDGNTNTTSHTLSLADFGTDGVLENGTLYTVRLLPKDDLYCYWSGSNTTTSTSPITDNIVTNANDVFSYGSLSGESVSVGSSYGSFTMNGVTYSYALKFDSKAYLQIVVPVSGMKLTLYYTTDGTSKTYELKYYTYNTSEGTSGNSETISLEAVGTSSYASVSIESLDKGTYRIARQSNQSHVLYVLLSYPE